MTHTEQLAVVKSAGISDWFTMARPGYSALRSARKSFDVKMTAPTIQQYLAGDQGYYSPRKQLVTVYNTAENPLAVKRHELIHGYQDNGIRMAMNPLSIFGMRNPAAPDRSTSLVGGLRELALETDARVGELKSVPEGVRSMVKDAPHYTGAFQGLARLPFSILGLMRRFV